MDRFIKFIYLYKRFNWEENKMKQTEQWTSKLGFIMAAAGSAIGLGAIWKFPYIAGKSGEEHSF